MPTIGSVRSDTDRAAGTVSTTSAVRTLPWSISAGTARRLCCLGLVAAALAGCSGPHAGAPYRSVNQDVGSCAAALPLARDSVGDRGTLVAIHPLRKEQAEAITRAAGKTPAPRPSPRAQPPTPEKGPGACVIAYRGPYRAGQLPLAPRDAGRYAVLIMRVRHPVVRQLLLVDRLPPGV